MGTLYHLLGRREDALDALQEAFVKCWGRRDELPAIENWKAWVFRVVINTARDMKRSAYHRRQHASPASVEDWADPHPPSTDRLEQAEEISQVRAAIGRLPDDEKEVFLLRENGELTYEEIAEQLDLPVGTAKTRMRRALAHLRSELTQPRPGQEPERGGR